MKWSVWSEALGVQEWSRIAPVAVRITAAQVWLDATNKLDGSACEVVRNRSEVIRRCDPKWSVSYSKVFINPGSVVGSNR